MMKKFTLATALTFGVYSSAFAQDILPTIISGEAIKEAHPEAHADDTIPVIVLDEVNRGIRLTGQSVHLEDLTVRNYSNSGHLVALIKQPDGTYGVYTKPLSEIDKSFGGDGLVDLSPKVPEQRQHGLATNSTDSDAIPVIAADPSARGIRLTGEYVSRKEILARSNQGSLAEMGPPTALVREADGRLATYHLPLDRIDRAFGGDGIVGDTPDGIDPFSRGTPIEVIELGLNDPEPFATNPDSNVIDLDIENAPEQDAPIELFPDNMSGTWKMVIVGTSNEGCSPQVVAAGETAGRSMFQSSASTQSADLVPSELIPDAKFLSGWRATGTDNWSAVMADVDAPNMATRSTLQMQKISSDLIEIKGMMQFNMPVKLAAIAGMTPNCTYRMKVEARRST